MSNTKTDINVVPLIDIVLVLLIIFIIMVPGMQKSLDTAIPEVRRDTTPPSAKPADDPTVLMLDIDRYNNLTINQSPLKLNDIPDRLAPLVKLQPVAINASMRRVILNVDCDVPYHWVVQVMDQLKLASEKVKAETLKEGNFFDADGNPFHGGDTKVIVKRKRRPPGEECPDHPHPLI